MNKDYSKQTFAEVGSVIESMQQPEFLDLLDEIGKVLVKAGQDRRTVFIAGNGGSWADAEHFAGELRAQFELKGRKALPSVAVPISMSVLTAWSNDYEDGYETAVTRDLEAMSQVGDVLIAISTSGKAKNIRGAMEWARSHRLHVIAISGNGPQSQAFGELADLHLIIPSDKTARIQEAYKVVIHILSKYCDTIEG